MSRLRRFFHSDRYFFVTCNVLGHPTRSTRVSNPEILLRDTDFACLVHAIESARRSLRFSLTAWVFPPDHWHAIIFPRHPVTVSKVMKFIKVLSTHEINSVRGTGGPVWQSRFYEHALRSVKDHYDCLTYIHSNPVKRGLVGKPEEWKWSSVHSYRGGSGMLLPVDMVRLPADPEARLY